MVDARRFSTSAETLVAAAAKLLQLDHARLPAAVPRMRRASPA
ncbi:MAG: hypothetical protein AVDCRST_MAG71-1343 [uncultured Lysobacter sp.]|uniref:Uncharacterized protein n=1 Tax=uncultured Lysobacter sp. TaxID=271060 RepID=A0A6J4L4X3_9GAMM|nr:MAG: hypothetical protein AVDCRST_MAG71-1343 [uncultured Lysobacter sp.]